MTSSMQNFMDQQMDKKHLTHLGRLCQLMYKLELMDHLSFDEASDMIQLVWYFPKFSKDGG